MTKTRTSNTNFTVQAEPDQYARLLHHLADEAAAGRRVTKRAVVLRALQEFLDRAQARPQREGA